MIGLWLHKQIYWYGQYIYISANDFFGLVLYTVPQKVPTFTLFVTLSNLTDYQNFCTAGKRMKSFLLFPIKPMRFCYV